MMFGICRCCTVPSGGIFDFWAMGGDSQSLDEGVREKRTIISRMPSRQSFIYNYLGTANTTVRQRLEGNSNLYDVGSLTSFHIGDYMDLWQSGEILTSDNTLSTIHHQPVSMNLEGSERLWLSDIINADGQSYDYFQHSGINYSPTRTIGPDAQITGDYLICTSSSGTSGVYVKWDFPTNFVALRYLDFTIENTFDKTILMTWENPSGGVFGTKTELWFCPTKSYNSNYFIEYTGGVPSSSGSLGFQQFFYSLYNDDTISPNELLQVNMLGEVDGQYVKNFEFRLVDNISGYTLDDISGYSCLLYDVRCPHMITGGIPLSSFPDFFESGNNKLSLVDPVNKTVIYQTTLNYDESYYDDLTGVEYYKYGSTNVLTGTLRPRKSSLFQLGMFSERPRYSIYTVGTSEDLASGYTGSVVIQRQIRNSIHTESTVPADNKWCFSSDGQKILYFNSNISSYNDNSPTYPKPRPVLEYNPNDFDIFNYYGLNESVSTFANTPAVLSNLSALVMDYSQRSGPGQTDVLPEVFITVGTGGINEMLYGNTHHFTLAEYNIDSAEKIAYYQKIMYNYSTTGYRGDWNAIDLNNFNNGPNLPKIGHMSYRDAPRCFAVELPRITFIHSTGAANVSRGPTGLLNQTSRILYGDIKQSTFNTSMLSGQFLGGGITGGASVSYNGGTTINVLTGFNFTGVLGEERPYTTFNYDGITISGAITPKVGRIYDFEFNLVHGDESGEVFWEESFEQNVRYYKYHYDFGIPGKTPTPGRVTYTGVYRSPATPNISVNILYGSKHLATNTLGASFVTSKNHYKFGSTTDSISGEAYVKLKIGSNIVYNQRLYYRPDIFRSDYLYPVVGPFALHTTNAEQKDLLSGDYAAFVWFEQLYQTPPIPLIPSSFSFDVTGAGVVTGWKMHVANQTGGDILSLATSGIYEDIIDYASVPYVRDSSDAFFYINNFLLPYTGVANDDYNTQTQSFIDETGGNRNPRYLFINTVWDISGAVNHFGMSHDCKAVIPGGIEFDEDLFASGTPRTFPGIPFTKWAGIREFDGSCVKNTALMAETPKRADWLVDSGFPYTTKYYTITGIFKYNSPTGLVPIFPIGETFGRYKQTLVSTSGFDLSLYPGYQYVTSGIDYIKVIKNTSNEGPHLYVGSGTIQSGWL